MKRERLAKRDINSKGEGLEMRNHIRSLTIGIVTIFAASVLIFASGCGKSADTSQSGTTSAKKNEFTIKISAPGALEDSCTMAYLKFKELVES